jgi:hypothetical protein
VPITNITEPRLQGKDLDLIFVPPALRGRAESNFRVLCGGCYSKCTNTSGFNYERMLFDSWFK